MHLSDERRWGCSSPRATSLWRGKGFLLGGRRNILHMSHSEGHDHCAGGFKVPAEDKAKALRCKELSAFQESSRLSSFS